MGTTHITADPGVPVIRMSREFDAPRELVYRAYADPELLKQWLGPDRLVVRVDEYDLRHGGRYRLVHVQDDGVEFAFRGVFHGEPTLDGGMRRTFEWEGLPGHVSFEEARFTEVDGRTRVDSISVFTAVEDRDGMIENGMETGVEMGYAKLDALLARELAGAVR
ncbi:MAG: SRPBCC family protein [Chloroflexota bacterium]